MNKGKQICALLFPASLEVMDDLTRVMVTPLRRCLISQRGQCHHLHAVGRCGPLAPSLADPSHWPPYTPTTHPTTPHPSPNWPLLPTLVWRRSTTTGSYSGPVLRAMGKNKPRRRKAKSSQDIWCWYPHFTLSGMYTGCPKKRHQ